MKVLIASDHGGFELKEYIKQIDFTDIEKANNIKIEIIDFGTNSTESVHYPVFAKKMLSSLIDILPNNLNEDPKNFGILVCTTGIGMSIVANRYKQIRAGLCHFVEEVSLTRKHNNSNVLCIGAKFTDKLIIEKMIKTFLTTKFEGGRHLERIEMFD